MNDFLQKWARNYLEKRGLVYHNALPPARVLSLIQKLYPLKTQFDLIRLGPNGDGGYLIPDCLNGVKACFSPGVARVSGFERDCLEHGMKVFMADKSVEEPNWTIAKDRYRFDKKFVGCTNNEQHMTLQKWVASAGLHQEDELLLQMDIEGGEYATIISAPDELMERFKIMVIEFHRLQHLWNKGFFEVAETVFDKILQTHVCIHLHPNNFGGTKRSIHSQSGLDIPKVMEFSFLRKDIAEVKGFETRFPHPLDFDNTAKSHVALPTIWYGDKSNT